MYSTWTVPQLKKELKERGASLRGKKADLIERLEIYDQNFNFGNRENVETDDPAMKLPSNECYRDINSHTKLPPLNKTQIRHYLSYTSKKMDKVAQLYESRHLVTARSHTSSNETYIKGICRKSMKKLHYSVDIKFDEYGNIMEAHCECPAGSGSNASCKHVAVLLFGIEHMVHAKQILLFETCTQKLQQFHVPTSRYSGTPIRAEKLTRRRNLPVIFEPYPVNKINKINYDSRVRSLVLNFPNSSMPLKQMYEPANPYSLEIDHNYTLEDKKSKILKNLLVSEITEDQIKKIEEETRFQSNSDEWHNQRQKHITASTFHTICHLRETTMKVYAKQLQQKKKTFFSRATSHGIINEKIALDKYCQMYDLIAEPCGLFISKERPHLAASPDALLGSETTIEIKCPYASRSQNITSTSVPYLYEIDGILNLKKNSPYYYQIQGQLYCTNRKYCNLVIYTYIDLKVVYVYRDEQFIKEMLLKLDNFFENYYKGELLNKYLYYNYEDFNK
ncbi:uncharacterized protein LOC124644478 [Helicoverpa zea]|uniref:uncharacterized protein LOC124644478 n=1 Tax=Helicoverpa zea TaxID=7113 RepID=UPI001F598623|nr:uncharacterized protein LOC124644478 [Helicoverpa zea]